jgi:hypothetical protein
MSECDVCVYVDCDSSPDFLTCAHVKARKPHKCFECGRRIAIGDIYEYVTGKWEGEFDTFKTCDLCAEIRAVFFCESWLYGNMWDEMREQAFDKLTTAGPCFAELSPAAKQFVLDKWKDWKL